LYSVKICANEEVLYMSKLSDIKKEDLDKLTPEELADLKVEAEDLRMRIESLIEECEEMLNG